MTEQITLYTAKACPYAQRNEIALAEVGVPFTRFEIDLTNKPEWYASKVNRAGKVPALTYGGPLVPADQPSPESTKIAESLVILELIAELFPDKSTLLPKDPITRAKARFFIETFSSKFGPAYTAFLHKEEEGSASEEKLWEAIEAIQALKLQEGKKYAVSDEFTFADAAVLPLFARLELVLSNEVGAVEHEKGKKFIKTLKTDAKYKPFWDYFSLLKERESFKKTFWPDDIIALYIALFARKQK